VDSSAGAESIQVDGIEVRSRSGAHAGLRTVVIPEARTLGDAAFTEAAKSAYMAILSGIDHATIARVWNFVPGINDLADVDRDRYMMFNAGRYGAFQECMLQSERHPVASGVGHAGSDLVIHLLYGGQDVLGVGNPRQCPPHRYSDRYGAVPPAFSRAGCATFGEESWFLLSGTASVVGEDSNHLGDARGQLAETIENIGCVVAEAEDAVGSPLELGSATDWLVYSTDSANNERIHAELCRRCDAAPERITIREQALCRAELVVEIECATRIDRGEVDWS